MTFFEVIRWITETASKDERRTVRDLLISIDNTALIRLQDENKYIIQREARDENIYSTLVVDAEPKVKRLKPGHYKARIASVVKAKPLAALYKPQSKISKAWWAVLLEASKHDPDERWTPLELAQQLGKPKLVKTIANTLGYLYTKGVVERKKAGATYAYSVKR